MSDKFFFYHFSFFLGKYLIFNLIYFLFFKYALDEKYLIYIYIYIYCFELNLFIFKILIHVKFERKCEGKKMRRKSRTNKRK